MTAIARTALLLPFSWDRGAAEVWAGLLARRVRVENPRATAPREEPFWEEVERRPRELGELDPALRSWLGGARAGTVRHLTLSRAARQAFARPVLESADGTEVFPGPRFDHVDLFELEQGAAVLVLRLDWSDDGGVVPEPGVLVDRLDRIRHTRRDASRTNLPGWTFAPYGRLTEAALAHNAMPPVTARGAGGAGLALLADWLLALPDELAEPPARAAHSRYVRHQTAVVLDEAPGPAELAELLFRLARALGPKYQAPSAAEGVQILEPYGNYRIGVAREGIATLSWTTPEGNDEFDLNQWPPKVIGAVAGKKGRWPGLPGIYLYLVLQVLLERQTLLMHSQQASHQAELLTLTESPAQAREALFALVRESVRFRAAASFSDCGGITAYSAFHEALAERLDVPRLRAEVTGKLDELFQLADLTHRFEDEQRAAGAAERQKRVDRAVALLGTPVAVSALLGLPALDTVGPNMPWIVGYSIGAVALGALLHPALRWLLGARDD